MKAEKCENVTVQLEPELLVKADDRADELDLNRSQYFRRLLKRDLGIPQPELSHVEQSQEQAA